MSGGTRAREQAWGVQWSSRGDRETTGWSAVSVQFSHLDVQWRLRLSANKKAAACPDKGERSHVTSVSLLLVKVNRSAPKQTTTPAQIENKTPSNFKTMTLPSC